ncbi:MAG TPA: glycosyltransferase family 4 protein [Terriglobales bacterium]|nr:glycosyltransferase family 4 protein [Terriglobales bacterium]
MQTWHIITCEYPPQVGGVSDYTRLLAQHLAKSGEEVHVWAPSCLEVSSEARESTVFIHRTLGDFSRRNFAHTEARLHLEESPRILLQYVPHGYGYRAMNIWLCRWIESLARKSASVDLMVHEPYLDSSGTWKQRLVSQVQRRMIRTLLRSSKRVFISIPGWNRYLQPYAPSHITLEWLPIPATIEQRPVVRSKAAVPRVGHLGTYPAGIRALLEPALKELLQQHPNCELLLMGRNSADFAVRLGASTRIKATGLLRDAEVSQHISSCDLMLQPYPDGLSTRRTSLMNPLSHGIAVVTNSGHLTEDFWPSTGAVCLTTPSNLGAECLRLLSDPNARSNLAERGERLYRSRFDWPLVVSALRSSPESRTADAKY